MISARPRRNFHSSAYLCSQEGRPKGFHCPSAVTSLDLGEAVPTLRSPGATFWGDQDCSVPGLHPPSIRDAQWGHMVRVRKNKQQHIASWVEVKWGKDKKKCRNAGGTIVLYQPCLLRTRKGASLVVQWLRILFTFQCRECGFHPWSGN